MDFGLLLYFQSFLSALLFLLAFVAWFLTMKKPFYDGLRVKAVLTLAFIFSLAFLIKPFSPFSSAVGFAQYSFQLLFVVLLFIACLSYYIKLRKVPEVSKLPESSLARVVSEKEDFALKSRELAARSKELSKKELYLLKLDSKLKKKERRLDELEAEIDDDLKKIRAVKRELARKESLFEDAVYKIERGKAEREKASKLKAEVDREASLLDGRRDAFNRELAAYRSKLQDVEDEKEGIEAERERISRLKAEFESQQALLKDKKKRLLDAYEQLDRERETFERERKVFKKSRPIPSPEPAVSRRFGR